MACLYAALGKARWRLVESIHGNRDAALARPSTTNAANVSQPKLITLLCFAPMNGPKP